MINGTFRLGGEIVDVTIDGNNILFSETSTSMTTTIEGLKLSKVGVIKEFPELEHDPDWRYEAIKRFKKKAKGYRTELQKLMYIKDELKIHGYESMHYIRAGHRPQKF